jgi:hypothetical protein
MTQIDTHNLRAAPRNSPAEYYRRKAQHLQSIADTVQSSDLRKELVRLACLYERLANQLTKSRGVSA